MSPVAVEAGADIVVVQSTVTTARHMSRSYRGLVFSELIEALKVPVVVGNCVTYNVAQELMQTGIDGILVGVGPGAACTTREVTGVGIPQVTATLECAAAREDYFRRTGRYVTVITDGGLRTGGDVCKAIASGADGVMLGTPFAQAEEAPGRGYNWGMANAHPELPRGTRIKVGTKGSLQQILYGPSIRTDGTQNSLAPSAYLWECAAHTLSETSTRSKWWLRPPSRLRASSSKWPGSRLTIPCFSPLRVRRPTFAWHARTCLPSRFTFTFTGHLAQSTITYHHTLSAWLPVVIGGAEHG